MSLTVLDEIAPNDCHSPPRRYWSLPITSARFVRGESERKAIAHLLEENITAMDAAFAEFAKANIGRLDGHLPYAVDSRMCKQTIHLLRELLAIIEPTSCDL